MTTSPGDGDNEQLKVPLLSDLDKIVLPVPIRRRESFMALGLGIDAMYVRSLTVYLVRQGTFGYVYLMHGAHLGNREPSSTFICMVGLYRFGGEWKFRAIGQGYAGWLSQRSAAPLANRRWPHHLHHTGRVSGCWTHPTTCTLWVPVGPLLIGDQGAGDRQVGPEPDVDWGQFTLSKPQGYASGPQRIALDFRVKFP